MDCEDNECALDLMPKQIKKHALWDTKDQFQFNDHSTTKIHTEVYDLNYNKCNEEWTIRSKTKDGGEDRIKVNKVQDKGEPGMDAGDYIEVKIYCIGY